MVVFLSKLKWKMTYFITFKILIAANLHVTCIDLSHVKVHSGIECLFLFLFSSSWLAFGTLVLRACCVWQKETKWHWWRCMNVFLRRCPKMMKPQRTVHRLSIIPAGCMKQNSPISNHLYCTFQWGGKKAQSAKNSTSFKDSGLGLETPVHCTSPNKCQKTCRLSLSLHLGEHYRGMECW